MINSKISILEYFMNSMTKSLKNAFQLIKIKEQLNLIWLFDFKIANYSYLIIRNTNCKTLFLI